jgi:hypothetical protein
MKKLAALVLILVSALIFAQSVSTKKLIDVPTAFNLDRAEIELGGKLYSADAMMGDVNIGIFKGFFIGISYGGSHIIGRDEPVWNGNPGVRAHFLMFKEDYYYPNLAIGFDSQGSGEWVKGADRYQMLSKGFYFVMSKNYFVSGGDLGTLGIHAGTNYCVTEENDENLNFFLGFDKSIVKTLNFILEYDFAINDDMICENESVGFLNLGLRYTFNDILSLEIDFKDVLNNYAGSSNFGRELRLMYKTSF